jgi:NTE family protein
LLPPGGKTSVRNWEHTLSSAQALVFGQPGFFHPRLVNPYLAVPGIAATSFYDTAPLYETLAAMVDFDRFRDGETRLSVGATDIETGGLVFFDTRQMIAPFGAEHVVASSSLPPAFPPTAIDGKLYWDGGCVSNTPLEAVLDDPPPGHVVAFVIDLWNPSGPAPDTMNAVEWRAKQIQYASRTSHNIDSVAAKMNLRHVMQLLSNPDKPRSDQRLDLVHIIYHPGNDQIPASDAEFSRASIVERRAAGLADMRRVLAKQPWHQVEKPRHLGCMIHRVTRGEVTTLPEPNLGRMTDRDDGVIRPGVNGLHRFPR